MFSRVILATDLSGASDQMVANLGGLLPLGAKEIILAHCMEISRPSLNSAGRDLRDALHDDLLLRAKSRLETLRLRIEMQGFQTTTRILYGKPAKAIADLSQESSAGLLIVGSRGASLAKNIVVGSSAMDILRISPVPVLLKKLEVKDFSGQRHYRLICGDFVAHTLYATDFSEPAERAFQYQLQVVEASRGDVTLLHVCKPRESLSEQKARKRLIEMGSRLHAAGADRVQVKVISGDPAEVIPSEASHPDVSLLIMGTHGKGFVEEFFLGSNSQAISRRVNIPILMIPPLAGARLRTNPNEVQNLQIPPL